MRLLFAISILGIVGVTPALAAEMPARKSGLWEIKMSFENRNLPAQSLKQCVDAGSDRVMPAGAASAQSNCSKRDVQRSGNTTTIASTCTSKSPRSSAVRSPMAKRSLVSVFLQPATSPLSSAS